MMHLPPKALLKKSASLLPPLGGKNVDSINLEDLKSTGHSVAALFPVEDINETQDAINMMIPTGTPEYGEELGVSFDDPVVSLSTLARLDRQLKLTGPDQER